MSTITKEVSTEEVVKEIEDYMHNHYGVYENGGDYSFEYYVDYRDEISDGLIKKVIENAEKYREKESLPDYRQSFDEEIWEMCVYNENYDEDELRKEIQDHLEDLGYEDFDETVDDFIRDRCYWSYPERFLNRDVKVNIMIDTGNWNTDCTEDNVLNWDSGMYGTYCKIPKHSSLYWVAKQQGKSKLLRDAIKNYDTVCEAQKRYDNMFYNKRNALMENVNQMKDAVGIAPARGYLNTLEKDVFPEIKNVLAEELEEEIGHLRPTDKFVKSCIEEWENLSSHMGTMTFLVTMPLYDFFELKRKVNGERDVRRDTRRFGVNTEEDLKTKTKEHVMIDKSAMCGLFSPWGGGGSLLDVALEKDIKIPINILFDVSMDGEKTYGYDVNEVYGLCGDAWRAEVELHLDNAN